MCICILQYEEENKKKLITINYLLKEEKRLTVSSIHFTSLLLVVCLNDLCLNIFSFIYILYEKGVNLQKLHLKHCFHVFSQVKVISR